MANDRAELNGVDMRPPNSADFIEPVERRPSQRHWLAGNCMQ